MIHAAVHHSAKRRDFGSENNQACSLWRRSRKVMLIVKVSKLLTQREKRTSAVQNQCASAGNMQTNANMQPHQNDPQRVSSSASCHLDIFQRFANCISSKNDLREALIYISCSRRSKVRHQCPARSINQSSVPTTQNIFHDPDTSPWSDRCT